MMSDTPKHQVVIIGGGFAGLHAAQALGNASEVRVTLIDRRNFHLFQPLLYQVATGMLSPADIATPLRNILRCYKNLTVLMGEVTHIDPNQRIVQLNDETRIPFDSLILASGSEQQYFGHDEWEDDAPGLKSLESALKIRRRIFQALESAEKISDPKQREPWLTFVVVGGGPTGVEMAGAMAELVHGSLQQEFRHFDAAKEVRIVLLDAGDRLLSAYPNDLSENAERELRDRGVEIQTGCLVRNIESDCITVSYPTREPSPVNTLPEALQSGACQIKAKTILWTAGVKASGLADILAKNTGCPLDRGHRIIPKKDFSLPDYSNIFVVGDLAHYEQDGSPLPGLAAVAMQEGRYVAQLILTRLRKESIPSFRYRDKGTMAIIGRNDAVAEIGRLHLKGFPGWVVWLLVHIYYLIGFEKKLLVLIQWAWSYLTRARTAALITEA